MLRVMLSVASLAVLATAQSGERVIAVRSLQPFLHPSLQSPRALDSAIATENETKAQDATLRGEGGTASKWLIELLQHRHKQAIEANQLTLSTSDDVRIALNGSKGAVNSCLADIDAIAATLTRSIEITVYQLDLADGELPPAVLGSTALQAAISKAPPLWTARAVTRPGGSVQLGDVRWTSYVRDQDAEVAKKAKILDPKIDNLFEGTRVSLTVHALPSEDLLVHGSWLTSNRQQLEESSIGRDRTTVDLPLHSTAHLSFGGRVRNGEGLVVAADREGQYGMRFAFVVCARYLSPPPARTNNLFVFPATAWIDTTRTGWPLRAGWFAGSTGDNRHPLIEEMPILSPPDLDEFLTVETDGTSLMVGSTLVVHDNAAACARAESALRQLVEAQLQQTELRVEQFAKEGVVTTTVVQPMLANMQTRAFIGTEQALIGDHEVEIAEDAANSNPTVRIVRSGVWSRSTGHELGAGWNIEGLWRTAELLTIRERSQLGKPTMIMHLPDYTTSTWSWDGPMPSNQQQLLAPHFGVQIRSR